MNIYNFMSQEYTRWKKTGKSTIKFPVLLDDTNPMLDRVVDKRIKK